MISPDDYNVILRERYLEALKKCYGNAHSESTVQSIVLEAISPISELDEEDMKWAEAKIAAWTK